MLVCVCVFSAADIYQILVIFYIQIQVITMGAGFVIRVKSKSGQKIVDSLSPQDTLTKLKNMLSEITGVHNEALCVLRGFPPKPLDLNNGNATIQDTDITSGETLIVEEKVIDSNVEQTAQQQDTARKHITENVDLGNCPGILMKMVVPADDSCLFTSVGFVLNGNYYLKSIMAITYIIK